MMNRMRLYALILLVFSQGTIFAGNSVITGARSIAAFGENSAYLMTWPDATYGELYKWDPVAEHWALWANLGPQLRQMDCLSDGTKLVGTTEENIVKKWGGTCGYASPWYSPRGDTEYDWVLNDPDSEETRGLLTALGNGAWESWDPPVPQAGDDWDRYLPAGASTSPKMMKLWAVDKDAERFARWERGDINYMVALNRNSTANPFYIYYYGNDEGTMLDRMTNPPVSTHNIDDVIVKQISYDEQYQNLWCIDSAGKPWQWDNTEQEWILRDARSEEGCVEFPVEMPDWLKDTSEYYVYTTYIPGDYRPLLLIFRETHMMHLLLGELSRSIMDELDIIVYEPEKPDHDFHTLKLRPRESPQKIVRIDSGKRVRENHHLERLLINNLEYSIDEFDIGVYPVRQILIRR